MKTVLTIYLRYVLIMTFLLMSVEYTSLTGKAQAQRVSSNQWPVTYNKLKIDGLEIFYREAGDPLKPTILLLHGFPSSSHMFRNLIPLLADKYHVVAPDYPGFGYSSAPAVSEYDYSFDQLARVVDQFTVAKGLKKYSLYVQ
ncbi:MAG TPA: alpha/beta fold hydrolase, partial [Pyrinomonadaceae bacterium]